MQNRGIVHIPVLIAVVLLIGFGSWMIYKSNPNIIKQNEPGRTVEQNGSDQPEEVTTEAEQISPIITKSPDTSNDEIKETVEGPSYKDISDNTKVYVATNDFYCGEDTSYLPATGSPPLLVHFWPTGGIDETGDYIAGYQFDWDGDGTFDSDILGSGNTQGYKHIYDTEGAYQPKFRIRGTKGTWSKTCDYPYKVQVKCEDCWQNEVLTINKTEVNTNISKTTSNHELVRKEKGNPSEAYNYNPGIYLGLKQDGSIRLKRVDNWMPHGLYETGTFTGQGGTGYKIHSFIDPDLELDTYGGSYQVEYWINDAGVWKQGPVIDYSIRLIN